jgi:hypothetical protein
LCNSCCVKDYFFCLITGGFFFLFFQFYSIRMNFAIPKIKSG